MSLQSQPPGILKPENITAPSTANRREFWAVESEQIGTNWRSLISLHLEIVDGLQRSSSWQFMTTCVSCGAAKCVNPAFCALCREADDRKAHDGAPRRVDPSLWRRIPEHIPDSWDEMSLEAVMAHFEGARRRYGAPQTSVEALLFSMRTGGLVTCPDSSGQG
jgi:hypothetical protein